ncbi:MAG TPA: discoidin domain-containing protein [Actinokineospora sp.]|nr:discoidin domain-containing protein [Actinokineospora sp.]
MRTRTRLTWFRAAAVTALAASAVAVAVNPAQAAVQATLYTSPSGSGTSCTLAAPCSITQAKSSAAALAGSMTGDIEVVLLAGTYRLSTPLTFTSADSGRNGHRIIWRANTGARPVISGGNSVTGWTQAAAPNAQLWSASAAGVKTRQLYANGTRLARSSGPSPVALTRVAGVGYTSTSPLPSYRNPSSIEMVYDGGNGGWTQPRCGVSTITANAPTNGSRVTMKQPCFNNLTPPTSPAAADGENPSGSFPGTRSVPTRMENVFELLAPGQWYLDEAADRFFYYPRPGENPSTMQFEAAKLEKLLTSATTPAAPLQSVTFTGLEFSYATWLQPSGDKGFAEMQANMTMSESNTQGLCGYVSPAGTCPFAGYTAPLAAVDLTGTKNLTFSGNRFTHLGGAGLALHHGAVGNLVQGNEFTDISSNGVQLGSTDNPYPDSTSSNAAIGSTASQSTTDQSAAASRAVDGNTDGSFPNGSVTHTTSQLNSWWRTDLGSSQIINSVKVFNRTDCCADRLKDFYVFVSDSPFDTSLTPAQQAARDTVWSGRIKDQAGSPTVVPFGVKGRYVMVQLAGTNSLSLAEVQVWAGTDLLTADNTINNNWVHATGAEYTGSVGIDVAHARGTSVTHNQVNDLPYTGISLGWGGWHSNGSFENTNPTLTADNLIANNLIFRTMMVRHDGGPIYTNGGMGRSLNHGLTVRDNIAFGNGHTNFAYYGDEGARFVRYIDNVQYADPGRFNGGCGDVGPIDVTGSLHTGGLNVRGCGAPNPTLFTQSNNTLIAQNPAPDVIPASRLQNAGLEAAYRSLTTVNAPVIAWTSPVQNNQILIAGSGFTSSAVVRFAGVVATATTFQSSNYLLATLPSGASPETVTVATAAGSTATPDVNVAAGKTATQSSTYDGTTGADKAVDGSSSSFSHTLSDAQAWWKLDLGSSRKPASIKVYNRSDCCQSRLTNYYVFLSDSPFDTSLTPAQQAAKAGVWSSLQAGQAGTPTTIPVPAGTQGRYFMVQLVGTNYLSIGEVQLLEPSNIALGRSATQSSDYTSTATGTAVAGRAVDGNIDGNPVSLSVAHTNSDAQAWWKVDLGLSENVGQIKVYNRSDCCQSRLSNYYVFVSANPLDTSLTPAQQAAKPGVWSSLQTGTAGRPTTITANATGRYVMVQLVGTNYLGLAEVEIYRG